MTHTAPDAEHGTAGIEALYQELKEKIGGVIVGQDQVVEQILITLLSEGHALLVGVPGLAKTLLISTIAGILGLKFRRIQFTPDLMPSDITGTTIVSDSVSAQQRTMTFLNGPIFSNIVLADEINRTPPKTQAALMEAMEERQVTQGGKRYPLDRPFFVLATQNPIEQQGTYQLPISQLDRFLFMIHIDYPTFDEEYDIMNRTTSDWDGLVQQAVCAEKLSLYIQHIRAIPVDDSLYKLANDLVRATRPRENPDDVFVRDFVKWGAGPRATQAVLYAAKAHAAMRGRTKVQKGDIEEVFLPALRHRIVLTYYSVTEGIQPDTILREILQKRG